MQSNLKGWLELIRPPNIFTVPGDPLAGFILAGGENAIPALFAAAASCSLYIAGLIWNDYADASEDAQTRPDRPLPSGNVKRSHALIAAIVLTCAGIVSAWIATPISGCIAILLAVLVLAYNLIARKNKAIGVITMGLCRGTSLLLGATAAYGRLPTNIGPWVAAMSITLYIIVVSILAHGETKQQRLGVKPWLPALIAAILVGFGLWHNIWAAGIAITAFMWLLLCAWPLRGEPEPEAVQKTIGRMIRVLLPMQAGCCALIPETGGLIAIILLALWPVSSLVGRWFYGS